MLTFSHAVRLRHINVGQAQKFQASYELARFQFLLFVVVSQHTFSKHGHRINIQWDCVR